MFTTLSYHPAAGLLCCVHGLGKGCPVAGIVRREVRFLTHFAYDLVQIVAAQPLHPRVIIISHDNECMWAIPYGEGITDIRIIGRVARRVDIEIVSFKACYADTLRASRSTP
jgi:hypothetical protein